MSSLSCPSCLQVVRGEDASVHTGYAKCSSCGTVFNFGSQAPPKAPVGMPKGVRLLHDGPDLLIVLRWFHLKFLFFAFFCVFWDGFLVAWYASALTKGGAAALPMLLFPLLHVGVGAGLTYYTLCGFVNKTRLRVSPAEITVRHGPLPWFGNKTLMRGSLRQLYCERKVRHNKNGTTITYDLRAVLSDGGREKIVTGLDTREQALYLEQELERHLGIRDERVQGEMA